MTRRLRSTATHVQMFPQLAAFDNPDTPQAQFALGAIMGALTPEETQEWHVGISTSGGGWNLFYCAAVSLCRRNKAFGGA